MFFACSRGKYTVRIWWFIGNFWNLCIQDGWNAALIAISGAFWWEKQDCEYWDGWHSSHRSHWLRWGRHRLTVPLLYGGLQEELPLCSVKTSAFSGCPVITAACFENCWGCLRCWAVTMGCPAGTGVLCVWQQCSSVCLSAWLSFWNTMDDSMCLRPRRCFLISIHKVSLC